MGRRKKDLYEVLGVDKSATTEQIKRAYKRKAKTVHPDVGGNVDDFNGINLAHQILGHPARRALYDATGETTTTPIEQEVRNVLLQVFQDALNQNIAHCLDWTKQQITDRQAQFEAQLKDVTGRLSKLKKKRLKITVREGENVFQMIVDKQIEQTKQTIEQLKHTIELARLALVELERYESKEEKPKMKPPIEYVFVIDRYTL